MELLTDAPIRIDIGAGNKIKEGWVTLGLEPSHFIQSDIRTLPLPDDFVDEARAIHVFEHLHRWEALATLQEWRRVLKPGARIALELPELGRCCRAVLEGLDQRNGLYGLFGDPVYEDPLMCHKWCYSEKEMYSLMKSAGFRKVGFNQLETHGRKRWRDMHIEGIK